MKRVWLLLLALPTAHAEERVLTHAACGHQIHHSQAFSRDSHTLVFDSRNDETQLATSARIGLVDVATGLESTLYQVPHPTPDGPGVGAASFSTVSDEVVFIHGLDTSSEAEPYAPQRRSAVLAEASAPGRIQHLDARDVTFPFTPGALRGGTHAHQWSPDGRWLSFTYNDAVVPAPGPAPADLRTVGIIVRSHPVEVSSPRDAGEFSGTGFTVVVVPVRPDPLPGSLLRASDEGWIGNEGYLRSDGSRQPHALAFIGTVCGKDHRPVTEIFIADLPADLTRPGDSALEGTPDRLPAPPAGIVIRRLTHTEDTSRPGLQGPRHWLCSSPDGATIAFLDEDERGIVQLFGISPLGGPARQLSHLESSIETPFTWSPCGRFLAASASGRILRIETASGKAEFLTSPSAPGTEPRYAVVHSPDGKLLAFNRLLPHPDGGRFLQICLVDLPG